MVRGATQPADVAFWCQRLAARRQVRQHRGKWARSDVNILAIFCYVYQFTNGLGESGAERTLYGKICKSAADSH